MQIHGGPVMVRFLACYGPGKWERGCTIVWGVESVNNVGQTCGWTEMFAVELDDDWTAPFECEVSLPKAMSWLKNAGWTTPPDWRDSETMVDATALYLWDRADVLHAEPIMQAVSSH